MEAELLSFVSNQGLAIALCVFLVYYVTMKVSSVLEKIAESLNTQNSKMDRACEKIDKIYDKVVEEK